MAKLIIVEGPDAGSEFELGDAPPSGEGPGDKTRPSSFTAGRDARVEIPLADSAVSRSHFRVEATPRGWRVVDLESRNQTFLNGEPVKESFLNDGDVLRAGDTEFRFEDPGAPVEMTGAASTILKEIPALEAERGFLDRLEALESATAGAALPRVSPPTLPQAAEEARKVFSVYEEIAATASPAELYEKLLAAVVPAVGADRAAVLALEGEAGEGPGRWTVRARSAGGAAAAPFRVSTSIVRKVAEEQKAVLSANALADARFRDKQSIVAEEIATAIAAPIACEGRTSAVLYADRRGAKGPFTAHDLDLLVAAARPAGALLEKLDGEEHLRRENRNLIRSISRTKRIIGRSEAIARVLEFVRRAAPTPMTVLVQGETGTGKELVASAVHFASSRRGQPFVAINCAALPENLAESELFGHERGAFTGAVARKKGRFELADQGTIFLDEVGELTLACQAKLLRLLEERECERVGGVETIKVDVRVVAATNKDLHAAVGAGSFREDLYYRLSVLNLVIPPLRERPEDIPLLAEHFLAECAGGTKRLGKAAEKKLAAYSWPGNVRQLRNVIESATVLGDGTEIRAEDIVLPAIAPREAPEEKGGWEPMNLEDLEKGHIQRVLAHTSGNKKRAAEILGIERCTLYAKIKSYGL
jgi:Nif-specific regulatory protein